MEPHCRVSKALLKRFREMFDRPRVLGKLSVENACSVSEDHLRGVRRQGFLILFGGVARALQRRIDFSELAVESREFHCGGFPLLRALQ